VKNILFRADGSKKIGMGHLNRASIICRKLLSNKINATLLMKNDVDGKSFLKRKGIKIQTLPDFNTIDDEVEFLSNYIVKTKPGIFFLDVLNQIDYSCLLKICNNNHVVSVVIMDGSERMKDLNANIILNGNPNQLEYNYDSFSARCLTGANYFIMDQDYSLIENTKPNGEIKNILVTLGGSDHNNLLFKVLKAIDNICKNVVIYVITTKASGYMDELYSMIDSMENFTNIYVDVDSLSKYWHKCDLAVTAGGNTLFERISTRTPGATICQLERQMEISDCFMKLGVNYNVGLGTKLTPDVIENSLKIFFNDIKSHKQQYLKAKNVIKGDGLLRLMDELHKTSMFLNQ